MKRTTDMSGLVATKGKATPIVDMATRAMPVPVVAAPEEETGNSVPLNFRVTADLRRRFRMFAAANDLKLNELLKLAFDEYEKNNK